MNTAKCSLVPANKIGKFAVVKLWPEIKAAEDENIARIKIAAEKIGVKCVEITPDGEIIGSGGVFVNKNNCDFVIHLHFETPKIYDVFSFVALWNPLKFFHDWGYERFSNNLLSHDDFLSCSSKWADDHVRRLISNNKTHLEPFFKFYHSLSDPIIEPHLDDFKLFYAGINWEKLGKGKSRHQELLDLLDKTTFLRIHGPKLFQGVDVWEGYSSYQKEIPFDGVSMIKEIAKCGASLVLSSDAHKSSELMSNRLFESVSAGALVICDENPFAKRFFGDSLLYINSSDSIDIQYAMIVDYIVWANNNPLEAKNLAIRAQKIFKDKFLLDINLLDIYTKLDERKNEISNSIIPADNARPIVDVFCLIPKFDYNEIKRRLVEFSTQTYKNIKVNLVLDPHVLNDWKVEIDSMCIELGLDYNYVYNPFYVKESNGFIKTNRIGQIIESIFENCVCSDYVVLTAPNESIHSNHIEILVGNALRNPQSPVCATAVLLRHTNGERVFHDYKNKINYTNYVPNLPNGFGRFIINKKLIRSDIDCILPYLDFMCIIPFVGQKVVPIDAHSSLIIDLTYAFPTSEFNYEVEVKSLKDFSPWVFEFDCEQRNGIAESFSSSGKLTPNSLTLANLTNKNRVQILASLLDSALPKLITRPIFWIYDIFNRENRKNKHSNSNL